MRILNPGITRFLVKRLTPATVATGIALWFFLWLGHEVHGGDTMRFDGAVHRYFDSRQSLWVHAAMIGVSLLANGWAIGALTCACVLAIRLRPKLRSDAVGLLFAGPGGQAMVYVLKTLFHRARPEAVFDHLGYSFPSGHSFSAVAIYGFLACRLTRSASTRRRVAVWSGTLIMILLIGFSRIYLGVHYASDVAAGFATGWIWLWACLAVPFWRTKPHSGTVEQTP